MLLHHGFCAAYPLLAIAVRGEGVVLDWSSDSQCWLSHGEDNQFPVVRAPALVVTQELEQGLVG